MSTFISHVEGLEESAELLRLEKRALEVALVEEFGILLENIVSEARSNLQNNGNVVTGELLASIQVFEQNGLSGTVGTDSEHAEAVENGRGPVVPVNAKVLHWIDPHTGKDVFSMYSGPTEPSPFMEPAVIRNTEQFPDVVVKRLESEALGS